MKTKCSYLLALLIIILVTSCTDTTDAPTSNRKLLAQSDRTTWLIQQNASIFGDKVPVFNTHEEIEHLLEIIEDASSESIADLCFEYNVQNADMDSYIGYRLFIEEVFSTSSDSLIGELDSDSDEALAYSNRLLRKLPDAQNFVHIDSLNGNLVIEPAVEFDIYLLRNANNLLVCNDSVYYFKNYEYYISQIDTFINRYNYLMRAIETVDEYEKAPESIMINKGQKRRIAYTAVTDDLKYKQKAIFKTHYYHDIFNEKIDIHSYVWVKNYKRVGSCYCLKKLTNSGDVIFNLSWVDDNTPTFFTQYFNFRIPILGRYSLKKYPFEPNITVYHALELVTSTEYHISTLDMNITNGHDSISYSYCY